MRTKSLVLLGCIVFAGCEPSIKTPAQPDKPAVTDPTKSENPKKENTQPEAGRPTTPANKESDK